MAKVEDRSSRPRGKLPKNTYWRGEIIWARFQVGGVPYRESLRTGSPSLAAKRLALRKQQVENTAIYGDAEPKSWKTTVVEWRSDGVAGIRPSTLKRYQVSLRMLEPWLAPLDVQQVTTAKVKEIVNARRKQGATNATIRRDLSALSSVLKFAVGQDWIESNSAKHYDRDHIPETRDPFELPEVNSVAAVVATANATGWARLGDMIEFAIETGAREEEIASLSFKSIDRSRMAITLTLTKARRRRTRTIPITPLALAIIDRQPRFVGSDFVFRRTEGLRHQHVSSRFGSIRKKTAQKAAQSDASFKVFAFHDLRHLFAVGYLRQRRGSVYDLQKEMGHESVKTTELYLDFLTPEERRVAESGVGTPAVTAATVSGGEKEATA